MSAFFRPRANVCGFVLGLMIVCIYGGQDAEAESRKRVVVAMSPTPLSSPVIIAQHKNYFSNNGLEVIIKEFVGGHRTIKAVFAGLADIATSSEVVVMFNSMERSDFALFATFVTSDNDAKIIAKRNTGIRTIEDMAGHRVGTVTGASAQFFLDQTLLLSGVGSSKVEIVHLNPEDAPDALASDKVDVAVVWEPHAYNTMRRLGDEAVIIEHDKAYRETFNAISTKSYLDANPKVARGFVQSLIQAGEFIRTHPMKAQRIVADRLKKELNFIKSVWPDFKFEVSIDQWLITTLENEARWAISTNLVKRRSVPNYLNFLHIDALESVQPRAVTVIR